MPVQVEFVGIPGGGLCLFQHTDCFLSSFPFFHVEKPSILELGILRQFLGYWLGPATCQTSEVQEYKYKISTVVGGQMCIGNHQKIQISKWVAKISRLPTWVPLNLSRTETLAVVMRHSPVTGKVIWEQGKWCARRWQ